MRNTLPHLPMCRFLLPLAVLLLWCAAAPGQQVSTDLPLITTQGSAEVTVVPDLADLGFEVEVRHVRLAEARQQQTALLEKVLAALRAGGVVEKELQTTQVRISPEYRQDQTETATVQFYRVTQSIFCTIHELQRVPEVTASALAAGATGVESATLRTSELRKYRDQARVAAVKAAVEKANLLARELQVKVGPPFSITENPTYSLSSMAQQVSNIAVTGADRGGDGGNAFAPGSLKVEASVTIAFNIEY